MREAVGGVGLVGRGDLWRAAVDRRSPNAHWRSPTDVAACATSVMCVDGEGLVLGVVLRFSVNLRERHGTTSADSPSSDVACLVSEDEALDGN